METYPKEHTSTDILTEFETNLVQASTGKRFANYIIDLIGFYAFCFVGGMVLAVVSPEVADSLDTESAGFNLLDRLLSLFLFGLYMFMLEAIFKGKSLGKLVTGTRAVNEDGSTISLKTAFFRGLSRAVPFEALSALGSPSYPWHDKWNNTYVIDEKKSGLTVR